MQQNSTNNTYLSFYIGKELFGANVDLILEVLKDEQITEIPRSEEFILGIINFRGEIVTVIDFEKKLNMPSKEKSNRDIVIVVELHYDERTVRVGLAANKVRKVFSVDDKDLKSVPEFGQYYNPEFLTGVAKIPDGLVMLLDVEKVLNEKDVQLLTDIKKVKKIKS